MEHKQHNGQTTLLYRQDSTSYHNKAESPDLNLNDNLSETRAEVGVVVQPLDQHQSSSSYMTILVAVQDQMIDLGLGRVEYIKPIQIVKVVRFLRSTKPNKPRAVTLETCTYKYHKFIFTTSVKRFVEVCIGIIFKFPTTIYTGSYIF